MFYSELEKLKHSVEEQLALEQDKVKIVTTEFDEHKVFSSQKEEQMKCKSTLQLLVQLCLFFSD